MSKRMITIVIVIVAMLLMVSPVSAKKEPWMLKVTPDAYTCHDSANWNSWAIGYVTVEISVPNAKFHPIVHYYKEGVEQAFFDMDHYGSTFTTSFEVEPSYDDDGNIVDKFTNYTFILEAKGKTIVQDVLIHTGPCP